jgi:multimeric flavodoxin WrbA
MKRIVVLAGSPRRNGNTDMLVDSFRKGAGEKNEVTVLSVNRLKIGSCTGCNACFRSVGGRCAQKDDMQIVYDALMSADALIIASPLYFYGISAQLKCAVDRLHSPVRNCFHLKELGLIMVGAAELPQMFDSVLVQYRLVLDFFKLRDAGKVLVRGARERGEVSEEALNEAFRFGQSFS